MVSPKLRSTQPGLPFFELYMSDGGVAGFEANIQFFGNGWAGSWADYDFDQDNTFEFVVRVLARGENPRINSMRDYRLTINIPAEAVAGRGMTFDIEKMTTSNPPKLKSLKSVEITDDG